MRKYLVFYSSNSVAVPLEALELCSDLRFLDSEWNDEKGKIIYTDRGELRDFDGKIIDESQIMPAKKDETAS